MGLLDKIKSFLGADDSGRPGPGHETAGADGGTNVTVEREPTGGAETRAGIEAETEAAVKGVETTADATPETETPDTDEDDTEAESAAGEETEEESEPVETVKGIGSTYADRLAGAGVETVADLLAADAGDVAEETDISQSRLETWQERAQD